MCSYLCSGTQQRWMLQSLHTHHPSIAWIVDRKWWHRQLCEINCCWWGFVCMFVIVRLQVWCVASVSVWQHIQLPEQICLWDTLACCWDMKQPTKANPLPRHPPSPIPPSPTTLPPPSYSWDCCPSPWPLHWSKDVEQDLPPSHPHPPLFFSWDCCPSSWPLWWSKDVEQDFPTNIWCDWVDHNPVQLLTVSILL